MKVVVFKAKNNLYAAHVSLVQEVCTLPAITGLARLPDFMVGIIDLRGIIVPIIDLRKRLGIGETSLDPERDIVILELEKKMVGLIVDDVLSVVDIEEKEMIDSPSMVEGVDIRFMASAFRFAEELVILLDISKILCLNERRELSDIDLSQTEELEPIENK